MCFLIANQMQKVVIQPIERLAEAGTGGADLVAFPEVFIPGYPVWLDLTNAAAWEYPDLGPGPPGAVKRPSLFPQ